MPYRKVEAACPKCGSVEILEVSSGIVLNKVKVWLMDDDGYIYSDDWGPAEVKPNTDLDFICFQCERCDHKFDDPKTEEIE